MKELIEKMIALLEEYKDKCCEEKNSDKELSGKYETIYKKENIKTGESVKDYSGCSLGIYKIVKKMNWHIGSIVGHCIAIPSRGGLSIIECRATYSYEDKKPYRAHEEIYHLTKEELIEICEQNHLWVD